MPKDTDLHKAAHKGVMGDLIEAFENGADVNAEGAQNRCAIHRAIGGGHAAIVEELSVIHEALEGARVNVIERYSMPRVMNEAGNLGLRPGFVLHTNFTQQFCHGGSAVLRWYVRKMPSERG